DTAIIDSSVDAEIEWLKGVIIGIRNIRGEMNISPAKAVPVLLTRGEAEDRQRLLDNEQFLVSLAKLESISWLEDPDQAPLSSTQLAGTMEILVPMAGLIDVSAEKARLDKEIDKLDQEISRVTNKLGNARFVENAPPDVVSRERDKLSAAEASLRQLQDQLEKIAQL
ncbi:MAG: valine--tRNA ligase, partial [Pseudohongiellaceae bacterium]